VPFEALVDSLVLRAESALSYARHGPARRTLCPCPGATAGSIHTNEGASMSKKPSPTRSDMDGDAQAQAHGKVANDRNDPTPGGATQVHQSQRSPASRNDRESQLGSSNQVRSRQGGAGH
jgi:hypothetical protein